MDFEQRIQILEQQMREHQHDGVVGRQIDIRNLTYFLKTVTSSATLTGILANPARKFSEQIFIDATTGAKNLYVYDLVNNAWHSIPFTTAPSISPSLSPSKSPSISPSVSPS